MGNTDIKWDVSIVVVVMVAHAGSVDTVDVMEGASSPKYHVVQKGDTLWGISMKYGVSVDRLVERNGIKDRNRIYVGQKINL